MSNRHYADADPAMPTRDEILDDQYAMAQRDWEDEYHNRNAPFATMSDAHSEWHRNAGVPMGTPGCPMDACHPVDDYEEPTVKCGNKAVHGKDGSISYPYHYSTAEVRECYAGSGRFAGTRAEHAERVNVNSMIEQHAAQQARAAAEAVAAAELAAAEEARAKRDAANRRYAAWRSIPVYSRNCGYYALVVEGKTHFYRVERPAKGKHAGRTFAAEQASDTFYKMSWAGQAAALDAIALDPQGAAQLYAEKIEKCSRCNRTLTDDDSIARGIGPECAKKYGA